jgi:hypothetical protein
VRSMGLLGTAANLEDQNRKNQATLYEQWIQSQKTPTLVSAPNASATSSQPASLPQDSRQTAAADFADYKAKVEAKGAETAAAEKAQQDAAQKATDEFNAAKAEREKAAREAAATASAATAAAVAAATAANTANAAAVAKTYNVTINAAGQSITGSYQSDADAQALIRLLQNAKLSAGM